MNEYTANLALSERAEKATSEAKFFIDPLPEYDVEREWPWFPWACLAVTLAGAFGPIAYDCVRGLVRCWA